MRETARLIGLVLAIAVLSAYLISYLVLSRQGFAFADTYGCEGFYFLPPEDSEHWRLRNYTLARIYYPLVAVDRFIGTGRSIACEPTGGLDFGNEEELRSGDPEVRHSDAEPTTTITDTERSDWDVDVLIYDSCKSRTVEVASEPPTPHKAARCGCAASP